MFPFEGTAGDQPNFVIEAFEVCDQVATDRESQQSERLVREIGKPRGSRG